MREKNALRAEERVIVTARLIGAEGPGRTAKSKSIEQSNFAVEWELSVLNGAEAGESKPVRSLYECVLSQVP